MATLSSMLAYVCISLSLACTCSLFLLLGPTQRLAASLSFSSFQSLSLSLSLCQQQWAVEPSVHQKVFSRCCWTDRKSLSLSPSHTHSFFALSLSLVGTSSLSLSHCVSRFEPLSRVSTKKPSPGCSALKVFSRCSWTDRKSLCLSLSVTHIQYLTLSHLHKVFDTIVG